MPDSCRTAALQLPYSCRKGAVSLAVCSFLVRNAFRLYPFAYFYTYGGAQGQKCVRPLALSQPFPNMHSLSSALLTFAHPSFTCFQKVCSLHAFRALAQKCFHSQALCLLLPHGDDSYTLQHPQAGAIQIIRLSKVCNRRHL